MGNGYMKKIFFMFLCIICFSLTACKKQEYGLVELSSVEFNNYYYVDDEVRDDVNIVLAIYNSASENGEQFINDFSSILIKLKWNF